ncbi:MULTISPECIES: hypothetical protein [unclassified Polaromonas]|uniref:hypothetical protein n=1 Tax=unclassified Polaromonas TaxID=2638319 RepID=UPI0011428B36|nr:MULTISPECIES: hypothetical protein [unclassified Polaromonas]MDI1274833.1 hypothetical protein [Polaromonas sp.]
MKRLVRRGVMPYAPSDDQERSREAALALLTRSIKFGHRRLAVIRLAKAVEVKASVTKEQWEYCERVAAESSDIAVRCLMISSVNRIQVSFQSSALPLSQLPNMEATEKLEID